MNIINGFGNVYGNSGYAAHTRNFFLALNKLVPVCLVPLFPMSNIPLPSPFRQMTERVDQMNCRGTSINIAYGDDMHRFCGGWRIGFTVFESTILPPRWIHLLKQLNQVWVPSEWGAEVLRQNGIAGEMIRVVPEGVDSYLFAPTAKPLPAFKDEGKFRFLTIGKFEARKGVREMAAAYCQAFSPQEKVEMVFHLNAVSPKLKKIDVQATLCAEFPSHAHQFIFLERELSDAMMPRLFASCDCYVSASRSEGWGLPLIEALSCGLPTIAVFHSGSTEFLNHDIAYLMQPKKLEPIYCPIFFPNPGETGLWASLDIDEIAQNLRYVFDNQSNAKEKGAAAAQHIKRNWQWSQAAEIACRELKNL